MVLWEFDERDRRNATYVGRYMGEMFERDMFSKDVAERSEF